MLLPISNEEMHCGFVVAWRWSRDRTKFTPDRISAGCYDLLPTIFVISERPSFQGAIKLKKAKVVKKNAKRREWTKDDLKELKAHSKAKTPVSKISKATKRTVGALRAKAFQLGIGLGHQR